MNAVILICQNTIQKEWRSKALLFLFVVTFIILGILTAGLSYFNDNVLTEYSMEAVATKALSMFFIFLNVWSYLISTYFGAGTVRSDSEQGVMAQMLSFPVSRFEYLLGRLLGSWSLVMAYYLMSLILAVIGISLTVGKLILSYKLFIGLLLNAIPILVVIALAMTFALYLNMIQAFISTFLLTLILVSANGYFQETSLKVAMENLGVMKVLGLVLYIIFPHISSWGDLANSFILDVEHKIPVLQESLHLAVTLPLLLIMIWALFRKKEV